VQRELWLRSATAEVQMGQDKCFKLFQSSVWESIATAGVEAFLLLPMVPLKRLEPF
jgi:hypothetical protein